MDTRKETKLLQSSPYSIHFFILPLMAIYGYHNYYVPNNAFFLNYFVLTLTTLPYRQQRLKSLSAFTVLGSRPYTIMTAPCCGGPPWN